MRCVVLWFLQKRSASPGQQQLHLWIPCISITDRCFSAHDSLGACPGILHCRFLFWCLPSATNCLIKCQWGNEIMQLVKFGHATIEIRYYYWFWVPSFLAVVLLPIYEMMKVYLLLESKTDIWWQSHWKNAVWEQFLEKLLLAQIFYVV
jgi:hypothetical protein